MSDQSFASEWNRLKAGETTDGIKRIIYPDHHLDLWIMFTRTCIVVSRLKSRMK